MELPKSAGFTLIELVVVMVIAGILITLAVPSYHYVTTANRIAGEINGLLGDMQFARGEAIKEGQPVVVCSSTDGATCANSTSWTSGWIVFSDLNSNGAYDAGEPVLRVQPALTSGDTLQANNNVRAVSFSREGFATNVAAAATLALHDSTSNSSFTRCLAISIVGSLAVQQSGTQACL
jgi:type IV fimbrial biogenesis protein FimT